MPYFIDVPAGSRRTVSSATLGSLITAPFSTLIESDVAVVADRTVTWAGGAAYGSHTETAVLQPATTWYLAEGATGGGFDLYYLLQNSNDGAVHVEVTYLRPLGLPPLVKTYGVAGEEPHDDLGGRGRHSREIRRSRSARRTCPRSSCRAAARSSSSARCITRRPARRSMARVTRAPACRKWRDRHAANGSSRRARPGRSSTPTSCSRIPAPRRPTSRPRICCRAARPTRRPTRLRAQSRYTIRLDERADSGRFGNQAVAEHGGVDDAELRRGGDCGTLDVVAGRPVVRSAQHGGRAEHGHAVGDRRW